MSSLEKKIQRINRRIGQLIEKGERDIAKKYAATLTEIRSIISEQFEKYEQGGELTLPEMLKHDRLNKLTRRIESVLKEHFEDIYEDMERLLGGVYKDGYHLTAWAMETETKAKLNYSAVRPETLAAMLENPVYGLTLNRRLERQRVNVVYDIQQKVTIGLQKNQTYATMSNELKKTLEGDTVKAMRIVRTEGHRVQEEAKHDAATRAEEQGIVMAKEWNTMEDSRVRNRTGQANHEKLNGVQIPLDSNFDDGLGSGPAPGQMGEAGSDINCRCFLTYSVLRVERRTYDELEDMTFEQWEKERLVAS